jgi:hypothetical protein
MLEIYRTVVPQHDLAPVCVHKAGMKDLLEANTNGATGVTP